MHGLVSSLLGLTARKPQQPNQLIRAPRVVVRTSERLSFRWRWPLPSRYACMVSLDIPKTVILGGIHRRCILLFKKLLHGTKRCGDWAATMQFRRIRVRR